MLRGTSCIHCDIEARRPKPLPTEDVEWKARMEKLAKSEAESKARMEEAIRRETALNTAHKRITELVDQLEKGNETLQKQLQEEKDKFCERERQWNIELQKAKEREQNWAVEKQDNENKYKELEKQEKGKFLQLETDVQKLRERERQLEAELQKSNKSGLDLDCLAVLFPQRCNKRKRTIPESSEDEIAEFVAMWKVKSENRLVLSKKMNSLMFKLRKASDMDGKKDVSLWLRVYNWAKNGEQGPVSDRDMKWIMHSLRRHHHRLRDVIDQALSENEGMTPEMMNKYLAMLNEKL